ARARSPSCAASCPRGCSTARSASRCGSTEMRRSREEAALTRRRIVEAASRLYRARGIDAVSVADVMGSLGLTVGGFYRHFDSKEALVIEAIAFASDQSASRKGSAEQLIEG